MAGGTREIGSPSQTPDIRGPVLPSGAHAVGQAGVATGFGANRPVPSLLPAWQRAALGAAGEEWSFNPVKYLQRARQSLTPFQIEIGVDAAVIAGLEGYAVSQRYVEEEMEKFISYASEAIGTALSGVIVEAIDELDLMFTGQMAGAAGWKKSGVTSAAGLKIPTVVVGMYPEISDAVENDSIRAPISYIAPIIRGAQPFAGTDRKPPPSRIRFWAERKLGIDTSAPGLGGRHYEGRLRVTQEGLVGPRRGRRSRPGPEGRRRRPRLRRGGVESFYALYASILRKGAPPDDGGYDFFNLAVNSPRWRSVLKEAERILAEAMEAFLKPPATTAELKATTKSTGQRKAAETRARKEAEMESLWGDLLLIPVEERRGRAIAVVGRRRALARRRLSRGG